MLTVQNIKDAFARHKHDISDVENATFIEWADYIYKFLYRQLKAVDPERFIKTHPYVVSKTTHSQNMPTDFLDMRQVGNGLYPLSSGELSYDTLTVAFAEGDEIVGATSGATATIDTITVLTGTTGILTLTDISGVFQDDELIQESSLSAGSATADGIVDYALEDYDTKLETGFGRTDEGYYLTGNKIVFTGLSGNNVLLRYIPEPPDITSLTDYFSSDKSSTGQALVQNIDKELLVKAVDLYYSQNDEDMSMEGVTDARLARVLESVIDSYKRTAKVYYFDYQNDSF
jgi:hypothetical protein